MLMSTYLLAKIIQPPDTRGITSCWRNNMIIAQVCLVQFYHNTMSQMSQVLRECAAAGMSTRAFPRESNVHFTNKPSPMWSQSIWQYIQLASQLDVTSRFSSCMIVWDQPPGQPMQQLVCATKKFLHKRSENHLRSSVWVLTWLQFLVITNLMASGTFYIVPSRFQTACMASCGWPVCWCQRTEQSAPWLHLGSGTVWEISLLCA